MFKYDDKVPRKAYSLYMSIDLHDKLKRLADAKGNGIGRFVETLMASTETTSLLAVSRIVSARESLREALDGLDRLDVTDLDAGDQYRQPPDLNDLPDLALLGRFNDPDTPPYSPWKIDAAVELAHRYAAQNPKTMQILRTMRNNEDATPSDDETAPVAHDNAGTTRSTYCSECDVSPDDGVCFADNPACPIGLPTMNDLLDEVDDDLL